MENIDVKKVVGSTPHMTLHQADLLTSFMEEHQIKNILELGFAHGVSTSYMAAALSRLGEGSIVTIDREKARQREPNIETLLANIDESERVTIHYEPSSYNWRLMKFLEQEPQPQFDLCYLDGAHNWVADGFAFFLVHRLLKPGGWIIFDDLDWSYEKSPTLRNLPFVKNMPKEERETLQIRKIYELLVKTHPDFYNFQEDGRWAYAQKCRTNENVSKRNIVVEKVIQKEYYGAGRFFEKLVRKFAK